MRTVTVASSFAADMLGFLQARGVDTDALCRRVGMNPDDLRESAGRIDGESMSALWRESLSATGDPDLGLHMAVAANPGALDIVGYVMLSSPTAGDALRRGARLMRLLNDGLAVEVTRDTHRTRCELHVLDVRDNFVAREPRQVVETILLGIVHQLRLLTGRAVQPIAVHMRHDEPDTGRAVHEALFGVTPHFAAAHNALTLANADLDVVLRSANPQLLAAFESHANATLAALGAQETLRGRVLAEIVAQLKGEAPTIAQIARTLAISPRHLQRGLSAEQTTFQSLLDEARRELALRHLAAPDATVAKVAWLVGFSEPSAFHRAFRRWTGHAPRAIP